MAHEVEFDAIDVKALEDLAGDAPHVFAHLGVGVVEAGADTPLNRLFGELLAGAANEQVGLLAAEAAVAGMGRVDHVVAVHAHAREKGELHLPAQSRKRGQWPAALGDQAV